MVFKPNSPYRAGLFAGPKAVVLRPIHNLTFKQTHDERALKQVTHLNTTLERYENTITSPQCIQWSRTARQLLEAPLALLSAGTAGSPAATPGADNSTPSHTGVPTHRKIPRP